MTIFGKDFGCGGCLIPIVAIVIVIAAAWWVIDDRADHKREVATQNFQKQERSRQKYQEELAEQYYQECLNSQRKYPGTFCMPPNLGNPPGARSACQFNRGGGATVRTEDGRLVSLSRAQFREFCSSRR